MNYIEDADQGVIPAKEMPNVKAIARDMVSKGKSAEDVQRALTASGLDVEMDNALLSEIVALETESVGDMPPIEENTDSEVEEKTSTKTSIASNPNPLPREENPLETPTSTLRLNPEAYNPEEEFSFDETSAETFEFGFEDMSFQPIISRTDASNKELAKIAGSQLQIPPEYVEERLKQNDDSLVNEAAMSFGKQYYESQLARGEELLKEAQSPKDVITFLKELKQKTGRTPTFAEQRAAYVEHLMSTNEQSKVGSPQDIEKLSPILRDTVKKNLLSADLLKRKTAYENSVGWLDMVVDFPEFLSPTATVSEEMFKNVASDIYNNLDKLPSMPVDKQMALMEQLVESAKKQETVLFNNNNSLMAMGQIDTFYNAILQGASLRAEGATEAEVTSRLETAFNGTAFVGEVAGLAKSVSRMGKFLMRRIVSSREIKDLVAEQERIASILVDRDVRRSLSPDNAQMEYVTLREEPAIVAEKVDIREGLKSRKAAKVSRKERKQMEAEKRELGILEGQQQKRNVGQEARTLAKEEKIKFKEAKKRVDADKKKNLDAISRRKKTLQEIINQADFNAAGESQLSRNEELIRQGRLSEEDMLKETGENLVLLPEGEFVRTNMREVAHVSDTLFKFKPQDQHKKQQEKGLKGIQEEEGLTAEEVAERMLFTPEVTTDQGWANFAGPRELNDLIVADEELSTIGMRLGRELEKANGTSLTILQSATGIRQNSIENSLGTFTFKLGDGGEGGFKKLEDAQSAAEKSALGYPHRVVQEDNGFFVEMDVEHYVNPYNDTAGMELGETPSQLTQWALNHARIVEEDMLRGLFAMKGVNRSTVQKLEDKAKNAFKGLEAEENVLLMKILEKGDMDGEEWFELGRLENDMGHGVPEKVFNAYRELRSVWDDIYSIREEKYYEVNRAAGNKRIDTGLGEERLGKAVKKSEVEGSGQVYDTETNAFRNVDELSDQDIIVKVGAEVEIDGQSYTYFKVKPEQIKPLVRGSTLNKRKGHIDRMYRDAGWVVKQPVVKTIDGVEVSKSRVTHIVKTEEQANRIVAENEGAKAASARENNEMEELYSDSDSVQFGYGASHMKKRGEIVKGSDGTGTAGVLNAFESMFKSIGSVQSALDHNIYNAAKVKFNRTFAQHLEEGAATRFTDRLDDMRKRNKDKSLSDVDEDTLIEMKNHFNYLKSLRQHQRGEVFKKVDAALRPAFSMINKDPDLKEVSSKIQRLTSELYIVWHGLYQGVQNLVPALWTLGTGGKGGAKAVYTAPALIHAHLTGNSSALRKAVGDDALADELLAELQRNGMVDAVGRSNDFLDLARKEGMGVPLNREEAIEKGAEDVLYNKPRAAMVAFQESPIVFNNLLAYLTEFYELTAKNGKRFNGRDKAEISMQAQKRTQTQNSLDQFGYQNRANPLSMAGQFMQAVHKGFLDWVVEPQWEVIRPAINAGLKPVTDKHLKSLGKNKGRTADTWGKAFMATAVTYTFFGPEGGLGKGMGSALEDYIRQQYDGDEIPMALDAFLDGGLNVAVNAMIEGEGQVDVNATMSPSAFVDMLSMVFTDIGQVNMLGASAYMIEGIYESVYSSIAGIYAEFESEDPDPISAASNVLAEFSSNFKFIDTAQKAYIGYWTERNIKTSTLSGDLRITPTEHILSMIGLKPEMQTEYYHRQNFNAGPNDGITDSVTLARNNIEMGLQNLSRELADQVTYNRAEDFAMESFGQEPANKDLFLSRQRLIAKWEKRTKQITNPKYWPNVTKAFSENALRIDAPLWNEYYKPYLDAAAYNNTSKYLNILEQKAEGEAKEEVKRLRESYKIMEGK